MGVYRTPESRFDRLPDFDFQPNYLDQDGLRMHYLDEGEGDPVLLLHGEPTWSYLYRKMIPQLAAVARCIAPDYFGFGRSDKPTERDWYSYDRHVASITRLVESSTCARSRSSCRTGAARSASASRSRTPSAWRRSS